MFVQESRFSIYDSNCKMLYNDSIHRTSQLLFFTNHNSAFPNRQYECKEVSSEWKLSRARTETTMSY